MEDQEPDDEGHAVGRQVQALGEHNLLDPVQAEDACLVVSELAGERQDHADAEGDHHEREGLLEQVGPAPALPRPPADHVAHGRACEPSRSAGDPGRHTRDLADEVRQLGSAQGQHRRGRKTDQAPASPTAQPSPQRPGDQAPRGFTDLGRYHGHGRPWFRAGLPKRDSVSVGQVYSTGASGGPGYADLQVSWSPSARGGAAAARRRCRIYSGSSNGVVNQVRYKSTTATNKAGASS